MHIQRYIFKQITDNLKRRFCTSSCQFSRNRYKDSTRPKVNVDLLKHIKMAQIQSLIKQQEYNYFLVLDFEATCQKEKKIRPQEVIEFPVLKVNGTNFEVESTFHQYVEPQVHTQLSPFCTELTGIIQSMVDGQPNINDTLQSFYKWMADEGLLEPDMKSVFVTCGDWDLKTMLSSQSKYFEFQYPDYLKKWINIKKPYSDVIGIYPKGMMMMLDGLRLPHQGRHHSGIDDCKNIARILKGLAEKGHVFQETGRL